MYNLVRESIINYKTSMGGAGYRENIVRSLLLLNDVDSFKKAKRKRTAGYVTLCNLLSKARELYNTGMDRYHPFGNLLREIEDAGFDIDYEIPEQTEESVLNDQIELIRLFMSYKYVD